MEDVMAGKVIDVNDDCVIIECMGQPVSAKTSDLDIEIGDFVLIHAGYVIQKLNPGQAAETNDAIDNFATEEEDEDFI